MLRLSCRITLANLNVWCSKGQPISGNQRPDLVTCPMEMSLVLCLPYDMHPDTSSSNAPCLPSFLKRLQNPHHTFGSLLTRFKIHCPCQAKPHPDLKKCLEIVSFYYFWFWHVLGSTAACALSTSQVQKVPWPCGVLNIWISKRAPRHSRVHFGTSPFLEVFWRCVFAPFWPQTCFAPQPRAIFEYLNFQKCSGTEVFHKSWFGNLFRATMACNFWSLIRPDCYAPAALANLIFRPSGATKRWKNTVLRDFSTISRVLLFFLLTASLLWAFLFCSFLFSDSSHLCCFICPYCWKFDF